MKSVMLRFIVGMSVLSAWAVNAMPIVYYDLDFEDGGLGGGIASSSFFGKAENILSVNLDGRALRFNLNDQMRWGLNAVDSNYHYVSFDYYAEPGANVTHFLDVPRILRTDINLTGRHRVELYYDFVERSIASFLDGIRLDDLVTIAAWSMDIETRDIRIANQVLGPGFSTAEFEIDNLVWQGNVRLLDVPEPNSVLLLFLSLLGVGIVRIDFWDRSLRYPHKVIIAFNELRCTMDLKRRVHRIFSSELFTFRWLRCTSFSIT